MADITREAVVGAAAAMSDEALEAVQQEVAAAVWVYGGTGLVTGRDGPRLRPRSAKAIRADSVDWSERRAPVRAGV